MSARRHFAPDAKSVLDTVELIRAWIRWDHSLPGGWSDDLGVCTYQDHQRLRMVVEHIAPHRITSLPRCRKRGSVGLDAREC